LGKLPQNFPQIGKRPLTEDKAFGPKVKANFGRGAKIPDVTKFRNIKRVAVPEDRPEFELREKKA